MCSILCNKSGEKHYTIEFPGHKTSEVTQKSVDEGELYTFTEGDLSDELLITPNGDMFVDGNKVEVTVETNGNEGFIENFAANPRAYYEHWGVSPDKFSSGQYTQGEFEEKIRVTIGKAIVDTTYGLFISIIFTNLFVGAVVTVAFYAGLAYYYDYQADKNPDEQHAYVVRTKWTNGKEELGGNPIIYYYFVKMQYATDRKFINLMDGDEFYAKLSITNH